MPPLPYGNFMGTRPLSSDGGFQGVYPGSKPPELASPSISQNFPYNTGMPPAFCWMHSSMAMAVVVPPSIGT